MNVKLFVTLVICVIDVDSQSTFSSRNLQLNDEFLQDVKSEIESIRQFCLTREGHSDCNECQAIRKMKSQIEDIREITTKLQNRPRNACPPGFDYLPEAGSCFKVIFERMTWDNATEFCRQVMPGVHLAVITSQAENDAIARYLQSQFSVVESNVFCGQTGHSWPAAGNLIWIGGQTKEPQQCNDPYVWRPLKGIEIPFSYTNWKPGYPDCYGFGENCAQINTGFNYQWNDYRCDWSSCLICELQV